MTHSTGLKTTALCLGSALMMLLTGCDDSVLPTTPANGDGIRAFTQARGFETGFLVADKVELSSQKLAGAETFDISFITDSPQGSHVVSYGLKTPYESLVRPVSPRLPMAVQGGRMILRDVFFTQAPRIGIYLMEIWLINDRGESSNHVFSQVTVQ